MWHSLVPRLVTLVALSAFFTPDVAFGRMRWPERDGKAILLHPRRIVGTQPDQIGELSKACPPGIGTCAQLAGAFISTILAAAPECAQQDACDQIIDASKSFDSTTQANIISLAVQLRQVEKNTQPNFTTTPPTKRNSLYCQKCPRNPQLNGLVQAQDPANNPKVYADPLTGKDVILGTQSDTEPFKGPCPKSGTTSTNNSATTNNTAATNKTATDNKAVTNKTATDNKAATNKTDTTNNDAATNKTDKTNSICTPIKKSSASPASSSPPSSPPSSTIPNNGTSSGLLSSNISGANFGSCSPPEIKFAAGLDGRKETAYEPTNLTSYGHGSAQNIPIITQFICDQLTNTCKANQQAKNLCQEAKKVADATTPLKSGAQADAFNKFFGFNTNFAAVQTLDDQGQPVGGSSSTQPNNGSALTTTTNSSASSPNFGSCTTPEIKFGQGFDGRKETSYEPADQKSYNHGSADNIGVITSFMCLALTNTCDANQAAKDLCANGQSAASSATPALTGVQADAFNKVFGIITDFSAVTPISNTGVPLNNTQ